MTTRLSAGFLLLVLSTPPAMGDDPRDAGVAREVDEIRTELDRLRGEMRDLLDEAARERKEPEAADERAAARARGENLRNADLYRAVLSDRDYEAAILDYANVSDAILERVNLAGASLVGTNFFAADLDVVDLTGTDGRKIQLTSAAISGSRAADANWSHANGHRMRAVGLEAPGMALVHANLTESAWIDCDLAEADLSFANLYGARFDTVDLRGATLDHANLGATDWRDVDLAGASFRNANLYGARLDREALDDAVLCQTQMPDGEVSRRDC